MGAPVKDVKKTKPTTVRMQPPLTKKMETRMRTVGSRVDSLIDRITTADESVRGPLMRQMERLAAHIDREVTDIDSRIRLMRAEFDQATAPGKEEYAEAVQEELNVWKGRIEDLQVRASLARKDLRDQFKDSVASIEEAYDRARRELATGRLGSKEAWSTVKRGMSKALKDLQIAVDEATAKLR